MREIICELFSDSKTEFEVISSKKKKKIGQKVTDSSDVMDSVWDRGDKTKPYSMTFLAILPK